MGLKLEVKSNGARVLAAANNVYYTDALESDDALDSSRSIFFIQFYDANMLPVTPTAGTITPEMSPIEGQWLKASNQDFIRAVDTGNNYTPSVFEGPAIDGRVTLSGIVGAVYAKAFFWRA